MNDNWFLNKCWKVKTLLWNETSWLGIRAKGVHGTTLNDSWFFKWCGKQIKALLYRIVEICVHGITLFKILF